MSDFQMFVADVRGRFPFATVDVDAPDSPLGVHYLDLKHEEKAVTVAWKPGKGFGFFSPDTAYGEGPSKVIPVRADALQHLSSLLV